MRATLLAAAALALSHAFVSPAEAAPRRTVVVTHAILGSLVKDLVGDRVDVQVAVPNGRDPHEWWASARDVARLTRADLVVTNGLGLEAGLERILAEARARLTVFTAGESIEVRWVGPSGEPDVRGGVPDPHFWTDPLAMKAVARALAAELRSRFGVDVADRLADLEGRLDALDDELRRTLEAIPPGQRKLVTGHESLGYFARRYGLRLVGAVVPGLTTQAEASAAGLAELKALLRREQVRVLFSEVGTPRRVTEALAREAGVRCVPLTTHAVPADGSYFTFMRELAGAIAGGLR